MIVLKIYAGGHRPRKTYRIKTYREAMSRLDSVVRTEKRTEFCVVINDDSERVDPEFPILHFLKRPEGTFLQVAASDKVSPHGVAGWYTLREFDPPDCPDPFQVNFDDSEIDGFFHTPFCDGLFFNVSLLCDPDSTLNAIRRFLVVNDIGAWLRDESMEWLYLDL